MNASTAADPLTEQQSSTLSPAQPTYVLRGHASQIHAVTFLRRNTRLLTGDADGWVVLWSTATKRATVVWRPHDGAILGLRPWGRERIITHGRDATLKVWQLRTTDEPNLSTLLPIEDDASERPMPWLLHSLPVNTLNFCSFAMCQSVTLFEGRVEQAPEGSPSRSDSILVAVPGTNDKGADIFHLPSERRRYQVAPISSAETGMIMALGFHQDPSQHATTSAQSAGAYLIAGYESGHTAVHALSLTSRTWSLIYLSQPHKQPLLSLAPNPVAGTFFTSSADAALTSHPLPWHPHFPTASAAATASSPSMSPPAPPSSQPSKPQNPSLLTQAIASAPSSSASPPAAAPPSHSSSHSAFASSSSATVPVSQPLRSVNTHHAGQQSLCVRSDGRILATAGWDARVRVYSAKTLRELAVLKWHREGCYAVAFAEVIGEGDAVESGEMEKEAENAAEAATAPPSSAASAVAVKGLGEVRRLREVKAQTTHWVAVGSKDGKVSLWEVY